MDADPKLNPIFWSRALAEPCGGVVQRLRKTRGAGCAAKFQHQSIATSFEDPTFVGGGDGSGLIAEQASNSLCGAQFIALHESNGLDHIRKDNDAICVAQARIGGGAGG